MDKVQAMTTFVTIVNEGSLTAAGEVLDKSLPTVVRTLANLEKLLGARLLNRTTRRMALTEEGNHYFERCRKILADIEETELELSAEQTEPSGSLRVTASMMFGQMHVSPAVTRFLDRHEGMQVNLLLLDRIVNLVEEGIDVAVRIGHLADSSMIAAPVGEIRRVICASPECLERSGVPTHPGDLARQHCIRFTGISPGLHWPYHEGGKSRNVQIRPAYTCNNAAASIEACVSGLGYGMFLSYMVAPQLKAGTLRLVLEDFEMPPMPVHVVYQHAKYLSTRIRVFVDWITGELRHQLGDQWAAHFPAK
jgi:DNA-binding transcriptional LysR family regulator